MCGAALAGLTVLSCFPSAGGGGFPRLALFVGRFHPVVVHLPIGLLLLAMIFEASRLPWLRRRLAIVPAPVMSLVLQCAAMAAVVTALSGWLLSHSGGYDEELLGRHFYAGLATAAGAILTLASRCVAEARPGSVWARRGSLALLLATNLILVVAADYGGSITHGRNYLTEYAPNPIRRLLGLPPMADAASPALKPLSEEIVFPDVIQPILTDRCLACHNAEKKKGGLRLDQYDLVLKGGKDGAVVEPGHPERSELVRRLHLPLTHDDHMPPEGKPQPTADEIAILTWWVQAGAPRTEKVGELILPEEASRAMRGRLEGKQAVPGEAGRGEPGQAPRERR